MSGLRAVLLRAPILSFFSLACLCSWLLALPLAWLAADRPDSPLLALHYLTAFGPAAAAFAVLASEAGIRGALGAWRDLFVRALSLRWVLIGAGMPVCMFGIAAALRRAFDGTWPELGLMGHVDFLPPLTPMLVVVLWLLSFGLGEELGWRGFALPRLLRCMGPARASLVLGAMWTVWHLPYFLYQPAYQQMGWLGLPVMALSFIAASVVFTGLLIGARGNLLPPVLFHAGFDTVTGSALGEGVVAAAMSVMVWAGAVALFIAWTIRTGGQSWSLKATPCDTQETR